MPPLITPRTRRRFGELVVAAGLAGALWGPVGSAEAGVSAGSTANARFHANAAKSITTGSLIGTGRGASTIDALQGPVAQRYACNPSWWSDSFYVTLGSTWSSLTARQQPCTSSTATGVWYMGSSIYVSGWTDNGTFICRGGTYGYGTAVWYRTSRGWIWAGGTSSPMWDKSRNC